MKPLVWLSLLIGLSGCVSLPDVYLIDRHTVMEEEASGEWPKLEARFRQQAVKSGPTNLAKEPAERRKERAFKVLNGEFSTPEKATP
jgi:hypothetical protein